MQHSNEHDILGRHWPLMRLGPSARKYGNSVEEQRNLHNIVVIYQALDYLYETRQFRHISTFKYPSFSLSADASLDPVKNYINGRSIQRVAFHSSISDLYDNIDACPAVFGPRLEQFGVFISTYLHMLNLPSTSILQSATPLRARSFKHDTNGFFKGPPEWLYSIKDELVGCAVSVFNIFSADNQQLLQRFKAGLGRQSQIDLVELALDMVLQDIRDKMKGVLRRLKYIHRLKQPKSGSHWCSEREERFRLETFLGSIKDSGDFPSCLGSLPFLKFVIKLRAESVEARIWKHLNHDGDLGVLPRWQRRMKFENPENGRYHFDSGWFL
ncbi:hypothetical protein BJ508DRAFT_150731 [Ascobolus immersus RN42]|uniref:Uncharacterized protein n=1 Tax=Ascobolus immersus RN42 TaxID=1160509 RepID=A0A3N4HYI4_ASCIM|nr:hypothetical protein BJ508DRAFT_150731 [Ascobolus immersus RN42]